MNYEGALVTPEGITKNSYDPQRIRNAVLGTSSLYTGIFQYPDLQSILLNTWEP